MRKYLVIVFCFIAIGLKAQDGLYEDAYQKLVEMVEDSTKYNFKEAVFAVENAYAFGTLDTVTLNYEIKRLAKVAKGIRDQRELLEYPYKDKEIVSNYAALYVTMTDTIPIELANGERFYSYPYSYDFEDIWGDRDWSNMFVSKLLATHKGNCHSLPYLYKILAEELGVDAHLALSPNHVYIKHQNLKDGWYNTELTSGIFPKDGWIMASGYVHLDGVRNGMYMKALDDKETIALLLIDLAQGYEKRISYNDGSFILKCTDKALEYYPSLINALLLKLETTKKGLERMAEERGNDLEEIFDEPKAQEILQNLNMQVRHIHELGYRQMPKDMYLDWLVSLKEEKEKYANKDISTFKK
jgi:hypothetical protein